MDLANGSAGFLADSATWVRLMPDRTAYYCAKHAHRRKVAERNG